MRQVTVLLFLFVALAAAKNPNLKWVGFWDVQNYTEVQGFANLAFLDQDWAAVRSAHEHGLKVLYNVEGTLFAVDPQDKNRLIVHPDYLNRWKAQVPTITSYLKNNTIFGIFFGDELVWSGLVYKDLLKMVELVRTSFPSVIMYYNEAWPVFTVNKNVFWEDAYYDAVPAGFDWISTDYYPDVVGSHFYPNVTDLYKDHIYPIMNSKQKALYIPPAYATVNDPKRYCGEEDCEHAMVQWVNDAYAYADTDDRWIGLTGWHWRSYAPQRIKHVHTQDAHARTSESNGYELGVRDLPRARAAWSAMGQDIIHRK